jgi:hypothetical protein
VRSSAVVRVLALIAAVLVFDACGSRRYDITTTDFPQPPRLRPEPAPASRLPPEGRDTVRVRNGTSPEAVQESAAPPRDELPVATRGPEPDSRNDPAATIGRPGPDRDMPLPTAAQQEEQSAVPQDRRPFRLPWPVAALMIGLLALLASWAVAARVRP